MADAETRFHVGMTCDGCANAVRRILGKFPGTAVEVDVPGKLVVVKHGAEATPEDMLAALKKWADASGKELALL